LQLEGRAYRRKKDGELTERGPYWYFHYREGGKQRTLYLGWQDRQPGGEGGRDHGEKGMKTQSTNGHGPRKAILYARVSTEEQARSGYSLAQQIEALREYAAREDYEVLEEVTDPGQSGASLARPGMD
jgi:hypothetical protein